MKNRVSTDDSVEDYLGRGAVVSIGVSGGKDSQAMAIALNQWLDLRDHPKSDRILIHADLGDIEWAQSQAWCERLAKNLGLRLETVRRTQGGLIDRWEDRWRRNVERFSKLECVTLIPPWSTAALRFCTSELKTDVICRRLKQMFPGRPILSASGIRREESPRRRLAPISKVQPKLRGLDWHPILEWTEADVRATCVEAGIPLHPAYTEFGSSRLSCAFCILQSGADQMASLKFEPNHASYRRLVDLEARSAFSFQSGKWLADRRPDLLSSAVLSAIQRAKTISEARLAADATIPDELRFVKGWPTRGVTHAEASILASYRSSLAIHYGWTLPFVEPCEVMARYDELLRQKAEREDVKRGYNPWNEPQVAIG